jgi:CheY-like chemotaxis protein
MRILIPEDDPRDEELTLAALAENNLANKVVVVHDGAEALDYLYRRGRFETRPPVILSRCCWTSRCQRSTGWKC